MSFKQGLIQVYTGDGDTATAAALGQAVRAAGQGFTIYMARFMNGAAQDGALRTVTQHPNVTLKQFARRSFVDQNEPDPMDIGLAREALDQAVRVVASGDYDLVILDQVDLALARHLIELEDLLQLLGDKPPGLELILTGRCVHPDLIALADLVTEMRTVKQS
jgi:cob(I)alamin adenosyltransferase